MLSTVGNYNFTTYNDNNFYFKFPDMNFVGENEGKIHAKNK